MIAYDLGLDTADDLGLLRALGGDCAGALVVQPALIDLIEPTRTSGTEPLTDLALAERLRALPTNPLGIDGTVRVSLPGMQPKLLLARNVGEGWGLPGPGRVSTHILKPAHGFLPEMVANEAWCMKIAHQVGIPAALTEMMSVDGVEVLVSTRFDRRVAFDGSIERVHQEDACQALSVLTHHPRMKYESTGGPTLLAIAGLLEQWGEPDASGALVAQVAFNIIIGNADFHGKNVSFVLDSERGVRLTPLYDVMSTVFYQGQNGSPRVETALGLHVANRTDINDVTMNDVVDEARRWGVRPPRSEAIIAGLLDRFPDGIAAATVDVPQVPDGLVSTIRSRLAAARAGWIR